MNSQKASSISEHWQTLLEGFQAVIWAADMLQYSKNVFNYITAQQDLVAQTRIDPSSMQDDMATTFVLDSNQYSINSNEKPLKKEMVAVSEKLAEKYAALVVSISLIRECIGPSCARSRYGTERLKRLINRARNLLLEVREALQDVEQSWH